MKEPQTPPAAIEFIQPEVEFDRLNKLICRAADLLTSDLRFSNLAGEGGWIDQRDQWLDDSGIGKFSKEALQAAMEDDEDDEDAGMEKK